VQADDALTSYRMLNFNWLRDNDSSIP
jgi:hypothetical protein